MATDTEVLARKIQARFADLAIEPKVHAGQLTIEFDSGNLQEICLALRDEPDFLFEQLVDVCGVDYLDYGKTEWETSSQASSTGFSRGVEARTPTAGDSDQPRFAAVYHLLSHQLNQRIRLRCFVSGEPPIIASVCDIWSSANWFEREAFDLFGILFEGHPDLRRILTDYGFIGHPFRKDFPISGEVEMRYDPQKQRVVYEPVSIEPRVLVPRVIRRDERVTDSRTASTDESAPAE